MGDTVRLYHGTTLEAAIEIYAHGFEASVDGLIGRGVYLSASIMKALRYAFSKSSHGGAILEVEISLREDERIVDVDEIRTHHTVQNVEFARIRAGCDNQEIRVRDPLRARVCRCHFGQRERAHEIGYRMQGDTLIRVGPVHSDRVPCTRNRVGPLHSNRVSHTVSRTRRFSGPAATRRVVARVGSGRPVRPVRPVRNSRMEGMIRAADIAVKEFWHAPVLRGACDEDDGIQDDEIARAETMTQSNACIAAALLQGVLPQTPFLLQVVMEPERIDGVVTIQQYSDGTNRTPRVHMPRGISGVEAGAVIVVQHVRLRQAATIQPFLFKRGPIIEVVKARCCCGPCPCKTGPDGIAPRHLEPLFPEGPPLMPGPARTPPTTFTPVVQPEGAPLHEIVRRVRERQFGGLPGTDERGPYPWNGDQYIYDFEMNDKDYVSKLKEDVEEWNAVSRDMGAALVCSDDHPFGMLALSTRVV